MGRLVSLAVAAVCLVTSAYAQKEPVTVAEANAVFAKIDDAVRDVLKMKKAEKGPAGENRPITRAEVVARMEQIFRSVRPKFQFTPRPFRTELGVIKRFNADPKTQEEMEKLVRWGFLAPVGPLVVGPGDSLSIPVFGDAVGYFLSQLAAMTYFADPDWVPQLQPMGGNGR
ncbi:MAG: hypothetical protein IH945_11550 [Armatimonadetes bacterium]|nr:hypothetical protein [Armatimonadota bacterium]